MRIIESIFNILFAITDCWQRTRDPLLGEYRAHVRAIITCTIMSVFFLILATIVGSSDESLQGFAVVTHYFSQGLAILSMISLLATGWCTIAFLLFIRENGFWE